MKYITSSNTPQRVTSSMTHYELDNIHMIYIDSLKELSMFTIMVMISHTLFFPPHLHGISTTVLVFLKSLHHSFSKNRHSKILLQAVLEYSSKQFLVMIFCFLIAYNELFRFEIIFLPSDSSHNFYRIS